MNLINGTSSHYSPKFNFSLDCNYTASSLFIRSKSFITICFNNIVQGMDFIVREDLKNDYNICNLSSERLTTNITRKDIGTFHSHWESLNTIQSSFSSKIFSSLSLTCVSQFKNPHSYSEMESGIVGNYMSEFLKWQFRFNENECISQILNPPHFYRTTPIVEVSSASPTRFQHLVMIAAFASMVGIVLLVVAAPRCIKKYQQLKERVSLGGEANQFIEMTEINFDEKNSPETNRVTDESGDQKK